MRPANERRRYIVTSSLIDLAHTQNDPWLNHYSGFVYNGRSKFYKIYFLLVALAGLSFWPKEAIAFILKLRCHWLKACDRLRITHNPCCNEASWWYIMWHSVCIFVTTFKINYWSLITGTGVWLDPFCSFFESRGFISPDHNPDTQWSVYGWRGAQQAPGHEQPPCWLHCDKRHWYKDGITQHIYRVTVIKSPMLERDLRVCNPLISLLIAGSSSHDDKRTCAIVHKAHRSVVAESAYCPSSLAMMQLIASSIPHRPVTCGQYQLAPRAPVSSGLRRWEISMKITSHESSYLSNRIGLVCGESTRGCFR